MTREEALEIAKSYDLDAEVLYCMDELGMFPEEALREWDIL